MNVRLLSCVWLAVFAVACSGNEGGEFFDEPSTGGTASGGGGTSSMTAAATSSDSFTSSATSTGGSTQASSSSGSGGTADSTSDTSSVTTSASTGSSATSTGRNTGTGGSSSTGMGPSGGGTATSSVSSTGGTSEPTEVVVEYESNEDCVALQCPERAPHLVACDITFSSFNDEYACLALEEASVVFIKSGDSCQGSVITAGSSITCSTEALEHEISDAECLTNKQILDVVADRCDCEAAFEIDEC